jgi:hypothetical protein
MGNRGASPTVFYSIICYATFSYPILANASSFLSINVFLDIFFRKFQFIFFLGSKKLRYTIGPLQKLLRYTTLQNNGQNCRF